MGWFRSRYGWAWLATFVSLPLLVLSLPVLSSGFDYWPAQALARNVRYGDSFLFAYPLPVYLPFAPLGVLADPWPRLLAPVICVAFLGPGLWLWGARRVVLVAAMVSPVAVGVLVNSNFSTAVAVFGVGLASWAKRSGHHPLVGLGVALGLWRPANTLPVILVLLASGWRWRQLLEAVAAGALFLLPITALAFLYQPDWLATYRQIIGVYAGLAGLGPHLLNGLGPLGYAAAELAVAAAGLWILRRRSLADAAAFALALTVLLAPAEGAYGGALALPAVIRAAQEPRYVALPALAGLIGWGIAFALLMVNFPVGVVGYWFVLQAYPLLRKRGEAARTSTAVNVERSAPGSSTALVAAGSSGTRER